MNKYKLSSVNIIPILVKFSFTCLIKLINHAFLYIFTNLIFCEREDCREQTQPSKVKQFLSTAASFQHQILIKKQ